MGWWEAGRLTFGPARPILTRCGAMSTLEKEPSPSYCLLVTEGASEVRGRRAFGWSTCRPMGYRFLAGYVWSDE